MTIKKMCCRVAIWKALCYNNLDQVPRKITAITKFRYCLERGIFMTTKEAYEIMGGNYAELCGRISESMLPRLLGMLLRDTSYTDICTALEQKDYESAFRGAHTLKGVALNLSLAALAEKADILTESLRGRQDNEKIQPALQEFGQAYETVQTMVSQLLISLEK